MKNSCFILFIGCFILFSTCSSSSDAEIIEEEEKKEEEEPPKDDSKIVWKNWYLSVPINRGNGKATSIFLPRHCKL